MDQDPRNKPKERIQVPSGVSRITDFCQFHLKSLDQTPEFFGESALSTPHIIIVCNDDNETKLHSKFPDSHIATFDKLPKELYSTSLDLMGMTTEAKRDVDPISGYGSLSSLAKDMKLWSEEAFGKGVNMLAQPITFEPARGNDTLFVNLKVDYLLYDPDWIEIIMKQEPKKTGQQPMFRWNNGGMLGTFKKLFLIAINNP